MTGRFVLNKLQSKNECLLVLKTVFRRCLNCALWVALRLPLVQNRPCYNTNEFVQTVVMLSCRMHIRKEENAFKEVYVELFELNRYRS